MEESKMEEKKSFVLEVQDVYHEISTPKVGSNDDKEEDNG